MTHDWAGLVFHRSASSLAAGFFHLYFSSSMLSLSQPLEQPSILKAVIYARVSTEEQKDGQTIDSQISELERFAADKGWQVIDVYKDEGWSGGLLARPELDRLRDDASRGRFQIILLNDVDRLARDVSHLGIVKRDLERRGVEVIFRKLPAEKSPTYNLMINILGSFAEFERELIADRTRRGRRHKVEVRHEYLGSNPPYGYRYVCKDKSSGKNGYLEVVTEEASVVRQMFKWVDEEGLSAGRVVARLNQQQVVPRRGGAQWGKSSVIRILRSETYAGIWHYNKHEGAVPLKPVKQGQYRKSIKCSIRRRPKSEWLPVTLPESLRLIDRERWQRVQQQLTRNTTFSRRNARHNYLLRGLLRCGGCGAAMVGDPCHGKYYYRCYKRCKQVRTILEAELNEAVWGAIDRAIRQPQLLLQQLTNLAAQRQQMAAGEQTDATAVATALQQIVFEEGRVIEAYRQGVLTAVLLKKELEQLQRRKLALENRHRQLSKEAAADDLKKTRRSLQEYCQLIAGRLRSFSLEERQLFLRWLINEIIFDGERLIIRGVLPIPPSGSQTAGRAAITDAANTTNDPPATERIATTTPYHEAHNPTGFSNRIAGLMGYRNGRNDAEVPFEVSQLIPRAPTIYEQVDLEWVRTKVRENPSVTLKELSDLIHQEYRVSPSISHMLRLQQLAGISRISGSRAKQVDSEKRE